MRTRLQLRPLSFLLLLGLLISTLWGCASLPMAAGEGQARNIILLIGDGMGPTQFGAAWLYGSRALNKELHMVRLMQSGRTGFIVNDTADSTVTESAAAATTMESSARTSSPSAARRASHRA